MQWDGWMMSDWGATHSTVPAVNNGLDQQMPDDSFFGKALVAAVAAGNVTQATIDRAVMRMLTPMYALNLMEVGNSPLRNTSSPAAPAEHAILARTLAEKSIALLQNDGHLLPFPAPAAKTVAVFGDTDTVSGGGSGSVVRPYVVTPAQGIATYLNGPQPPAPPAVCAFDPDIDYYQAGGSGVDSTGPQDCCNKCGASPTCKAWTFDPSGNTCYLKPNASGRTPHKGLTSGNLTGAPAPPAANGTSNVTYYPTQDAGAAVAASAGADLVVMVVATDSSEGSDRTDLFLPAWQNAMVTALAQAGRPLVVVARCPGACHMPWSTAGRMAILYQLLPGQEAGNALANTIFGDNNPSGRLPVTFPAPPASGSGLPTDTWLSPPGGGPVMPTSYPGTDRGNGFPEADFTEGLLMGYRWYDAQGTKPEWPFGHGLSYSVFTYSNLAVVGAVSPTASAVIYADICNDAASPAGSEVAQMYLGYPAAAGEPPKLLKGFQKVAIGSGECAGVAFNVAASDLWVWDVVSQAWVLTPGTYTVMVGSTSADIRLTGSLTVTA
jgi:beta-glucosidase